MNIEELEIEPEAVESHLREPDDRTKLIDVREEWELARGVLPGAVHVPLSQFQEHLSDFSPGEQYIIYCEHGVRSLHVVEWLAANLHLDAKSMRGGFAEWTGPVATHNGGSH